MKKELASTSLLVILQCWSISDGSNIDQPAVINLYILLLTCIIISLV